VEDYWRLTKPRIWGLLVFTGIVAMIVAYKETPGSTLSLRLFVTGAASLVLGSASAEVLTNYHDRDIDSLMKRTMRRALPSGHIKPSNALVFGLVMAALSLLVPFLLINAISASFMLIGLLDNDVVY
jgi:protoheme IX farnesyltransferase